MDVLCLRHPRAPAPFDNPYLWNNGRLEAPGDIHECRSHANPRSDRFLEHRGALPRGAPDDYGSAPPPFHARMAVTRLPWRDSTRPSMGPTTTGARHYDCDSMADGKMRVEY
jgi:hypothetical protein